MAISSISSIHTALAAPPEVKPRQAAQEVVAPGAALGKAEPKPSDPASLQVQEGRLQFRASAEVITTAQRLVTELLDIWV